MRRSISAEIQALEALLAAAREAQALEEAAGRAREAYGKAREAFEQQSGPTRGEPPTLTLVPPLSGRTGRPRAPLSEDERVNRRREKTRARQARLRAKKGGAQ